MNLRTSAKMVPNLFYSVTEENEIEPPQLTHEKELFRESQNAPSSRVGRKKERKHRHPKHFLEEPETQQNQQQQIQNKQNLEISSFPPVMANQQCMRNQQNADIRQKPKLILDLAFQEDEEEENNKEEKKQVVDETLPESQNTTEELNVNLKRLHLLDWASECQEESANGVEAIVPYEQEKIQPKKEIQGQLQNLDVTRDFLFRQIQQNKTMKCIMRRDKKNAEGITQYNVYFEHNLQHVLTIKKEGVWKYSFYLRQTRPGPHFLYDKVASLWSTFFGNNYTLIKHHQKYSLLTVSYETNLLGLNGPRRMKVYTPKKAVPFEYLNQCEDDKEWKSQITKFVNKQATWDQKLKCYTLNFRGRALKSSIKNFVITDQRQGDNYFIVFAKADQQVYHLDISYPFSLIQGVAVAISSFQRKLTCD